LTGFNQVQRAVSDLLDVVDAKKLMKNNLFRSVLLNIARYGYGSIPMKIPFWMGVIHIHFNPAMY